MSSKVIIGGAVTVAAGYALYEYQLQQKRQQSTLQPASINRGRDAHLFENKGEHAGAKLDSAADDARKHVNEWARGADEKVTSTMAEVERAKAKGTQWVSDQLGDAKDAVKDRSDLYLERSGELNDIVETTNDRERANQNRLKRIVNDARDQISSDIRNIKDGVSEDASSIKDALVGAKRQGHETAKSWENSARDTAADAKEATKETSESIFNWGFSKAEKARALAIQEYDQANKQYNELSEKYKSESGLFSGGSDALKKQVDEAHAKLDEYKHKLEDATTKYSKYTTENINELSDQLEEQDRNLRKKGFFKWLTGDNSQKKSYDVDEVASHSVLGWGETAEALAKEQLDELVRNEKIGPSEAQQRLNELKKIKQEGWFTYKGKNDEDLAKRAAKALKGWGETASDLAQEEYEEARRKMPQTSQSVSDAVDMAKHKLDAAKKQLDDTTSSWWSQGKEKKEDLREKAQQQYDQAEREYKSSVETLSEWSDKAKGRFWSNADSALGATKSTADTLHSKAKEGLDTAQSYVQEKKD
ncbi:LANO_0H08130g1_1 [Lachancea nothofagi CBS 11611]|uniref:LANO_0H08130g1_1 n=1 Tax=Lachancea nothofagi CBS 11611 TaxID=1266666 RepID=A0A1G4KLV2_9SACH|nr:LANO_0H08130g1_1 [Lachancea nothofagi CBS 11611]